MPEVSGGSHPVPFPPCYLLSHLLFGKAHFGDLDKWEAEGTFWSAQNLFVALFEQEKSLWGWRRAGRDWGGDQAPVGLHGLLSAPWWQGGDDLTPIPNPIMAGT